MSVCCISVKSVFGKWFQGTYASRETFVPELMVNDFQWKNRPEVENNLDFKQIIPYILVKNSEGEFACYQRKGAEKRLHNLWSCGVGGHIDDCDLKPSPMATIMTGVMRELSEEFLDFDSSKCNLSLLGTIHEDSTVVGLHHIGIVFLLEIFPDKSLMPAEELADCMWLNRNELTYRNLESWSHLALQLEGTLCLTL